MNGHGAPPDHLDRLGEHAAALAAAAGNHAGLLLGEAHFRIAKTVRESLLGLAITFAGVLASVVGYYLLVREVAHWLAVSIGWQRPEPVTVGVYLVATALPLALLKLRAWWNSERDLTRLERRHRHPGP